jgi:hypothetical protein
VRSNRPASRQQSRSDSWEHQIHHSKANRHPHISNGDVQEEASRARPSQGGVRFIHGVPVAAESAEQQASNTKASEI